MRQGIWVARQDLVRLEGAHLVRELRRLVRELKVLAREPKVLHREPKVLAREPKSWDREPGLLASEAGSLAPTQDLVPARSSPTGSRAKSSASSIEQNPVSMQES